MQKDFTVSLAGPELSVDQDLIESHLPLPPKSWHLKVCATVSGPNWSFWVFVFFFNFQDPGSQVC